MTPAAQCLTSAEFARFVWQCVALFCATRIVGPVLSTVIISFHQGWQRGKRGEHPRQLLPANPAKWWEGQ